MQVGNVIVIKNGVVDKNIAFIATEQGVVTQGSKAGTSLSYALEETFYAECRQLNSDLPAEMLSDEDELPEDYPSFDNGYYEYENQTVCLTWATTP